MINVPLKAIPEHHLNNLGLDISGLLYNRSLKCDGNQGVILVKKRAWFNVLSNIFNNLCGVLSKIYPISSVEAHGDTLEHDPKLPYSLEVKEALQLHDDRLYSLHFPTPYSVTFSEDSTVGSYNKTYNLVVGKGELTYETSVCCHISNSLLFICNAAKRIKEHNQYVPIRIPKRKLIKLNPKLTKAFPLFVNVDVLYNPKNNNVKSSVKINLLGMIFYVTLMAVVQLPVMLFKALKEVIGEFIYEVKSGVNPQIRTYTGDHEIVKFIKREVGESD